MKVTTHFEIPTVPTVFLFKMFRLKTSMDMIVVRARIPLK